MTKSQYAQQKTKILKGMHEKHKNKQKNENKIKKHVPRII